MILDSTDNTASRQRRTPDVRSRASLLRALTDWCGDPVAAEGLPEEGFDLASSVALGLRRDIGAVFQDYVPWQLTVRENIGFEDISRLNDEAALHHPAGQAGILELIEDLPGGLDSYLGRQFGDRDVSGGQWQRIALARAFFRNSRFLALDEPTAALDPMAEQRLFEHFAKLANARMSILVCHRLRPVRFADRVVVMEGVESGNRVAKTI